MFEPFKKRLKSSNCSKINPPTKPRKRPKYWRLLRLFRKIIATSIKVIIGLKVVIITLPEPAKPCLIPIKEKTIKLMFKIELEAMYFRELAFRVRGLLKW